MPNGNVTYKSISLARDRAQYRSTRHAARCLELSLMKSGAQFGAAYRPFPTPTAVATLHDPSGGEPSRFAAPFPIVFLSLS